MPEYNKGLIAKTFQVSDNKNTKCTIIVTTNTYCIGIDNPDIKLVV